MATLPPVSVNSPRIHFEIMEIVIDILNADENIDAIKACSQTCKALLPRCRTHIFSRIDLDPGQPQNGGDSDDYVECPSEPTRRTLLFFDLLNRTPEIAFYVRDLDLYIGPEESHYPKTIHALNLLCNLTSFSLRHDGSSSRESSLNWDDISPDFISAIHRIINSPKLTQLDFASINNFPLSIFSLCTGIQDLSLWGITVPSVYGNRSTGSAENLISLRTLSCDETGIVLVGGILMNSKRSILDLTRVHRVIVSLHEEMGNACLREILSASEALEKIHLHGTSSHTYRGVALSIASRSRNTLQSFQLTMYIVSSGLNIIPEICTELETLSAAPNLQYISLSLNLESHYRFPTGVLLALDRLLTGMGFPRLVRVEFSVSASAKAESEEGRKFKEAMEAVIREEFLCLPRRGLQIFNSSVTIQPV